MAVRQFTVDAVPPISARDFHRIIADFIRHLYEHGLRMPRRLSAAPSLAEALSLIDQSYSGEPADRYDAALHDATRAEEGALNVVLTSLAEAIRINERTKYVRWVFAQYVDTADWHTRCAMAALWVSDHGAFLPPELRRCPPAQLAGEIPGLITLCVGTQGLP